MMCGMVLLMESVASFRTIRPSKARKNVINSPILGTHFITDIPPMFFSSTASTSHLSKSRRATGFAPLSFLLSTHEDPSILATAAPKVKSHAAAQRQNVESKT